MKENESPGINPNMDGTLILTRALREHNGEKPVSSTNRTEKTGFPCEKE